MVKFLKAGLRKQSAFLFFISVVWMVECYKFTLSEIIVLMKRLLLPFLIAFFCFSGVLKAQPTLTAGNSGFRIGDEYLLGGYSGGFFFFSNPKIGANQIWNFSQSSSSAYDSIKIFYPHQVPGNINIQGANLVMYSTNKDFNNYAHYRWMQTDSTRITELATLLRYSTNNTPIIYNESGDIMRYPVDFGDIFVDSVLYSYPGANNITCNIRVNNTVEAVGYGQLITPVATYNQVLQVKTINELISNSCRSGSVGGQSYITTYSWHVPGINLPVVQITENSASLGYYYAGYYLHSATLSSKEDLTAQLNFQTFPNPATSEVTIQAKFTKPSEVKLVLTDALGKEVLKRNSKPRTDGTFSQKLDVRNLPKGLYTLRLETEGNVAVKKLVLQ